MALVSTVQCQLIILIMQAERRSDHWLNRKKGWHWQRIVTLSRILWLRFPIYDDNEPRHVPCGCARLCSLFCIKIACIDAPANYASSLLWSHSGGELLSMSASLRGWPPWRISGYGLRLLSARLCLRSPPVVAATFRWVWTARTLVYLNLGTR